MTLHKRPRLTSAGQPSALVLAFASSFVAGPVVAAGKVAPPPHQREVDRGSSKVQFGVQCAPFRGALQTFDGKTVKLEHQGGPLPGLVIRGNYGVTDPKPKTLAAPQNATGLK